MTPVALKREEEQARWLLLENAVAYCVLLSYQWHGDYDDSWAGRWVGRQHVEVPSLDVAAFIGFAAQAKLSSSGLRAPERPLFTPSLLVLSIQVTRRGRKG